MKVVGISGSPSPRSRSAWLLQLALARLEGLAGEPAILAVRELPPAPLLAADLQHRDIRAAVDDVSRADLVVVATPIYKAAYSGLLKTFLDLLPQRRAARQDRAAAGHRRQRLAHLLALDYALKPVLCCAGRTRHPRRRVRHRRAAARRTSRAATCPTLRWSSGWTARLQPLLRRRVPRARWPCDVAPDARLHRLSPRPARAIHPRRPCCSA